MARLGLKLGLIVPAILAAACGSSAGSSGGGTLGECDALHSCCDDIADATVNQKCHDQATQLAGAQNGAQACATAIQGYTAAGMCGAGGVGGGGGSGGGSGSACSDLGACCAGGDASFQRT